MSVYHLSTMYCTSLFQFHCSYIYMSSGKTHILESFQSHSQKTNNSGNICLPETMNATLRSANGLLLLNIYQNYSGGSFLIKPSAHMGPVSLSARAMSKIRHTPTCSTLPRKIIIHHSFTWDVRTVIYNAGAERRRSARQMRVKVASGCYFTWLNLKTWKND